MSAGHDHMVIGFTYTIGVLSTYRFSIQPCVIRFITDLRHFPTRKPTVIM